MHEKQAIRRSVWVSVHHLFWGRWKPGENVDRTGLSQDFPDAFRLFASSLTFKHVHPSGNPHTWSRFIKINSANVLFKACHTCSFERTINGLINKKERKRKYNFFFKVCCTCNYKLWGTQFSILCSCWSYSLFLLFVSLESPFWSGSGGTSMVHTPFIGKNSNSQSGHIGRDHVGDRGIDGELYYNISWTSRGWGHEMGFSWFVLMPNDRLPWIRWWGILFQKWNSDTSWKTICWMKLLRPWCW